MPMTVGLTDLVGTPAVGVKATISGSSGGSIQTYFTPVGRPYPGDAWTTGPTRAGDGDVNILTSVPGLYFVYAAEGASSTPPLIGMASQSGSAVATRCRDAVVDLLKLLNLEQIGDRVIPQIYPDDTELKYPCVCVHVAGLNESQEQQLNAVDDIVYPVRVMIFDIQNPRDHRALPKYERWRERIFRAFRNQHLPGVNESVKVRVEPLVIADQELPKYQHFASGFIVRVTVREPRGVGA